MAGSIINFSIYRQIYTKTPHRERFFRTTFKTYKLQISVYQDWVSQKQNRPIIVAGPLQY